MKAARLLRGVLARPNVRGRRPPPETGTSSNAGVELTGPFELKTGSGGSCEAILLGIAELLSVLFHHRRSNLGIGRGGSLNPRDEV